VRNVQRRTQFFSACCDDGFHMILLNDVSTSPEEE
jgi:hypothetical protein